MTLGHDRHRMAVTLEIEPQDLPETRLVLDDQDPGTGDHGTHPSREAIKET